MVASFLYPRLFVDIVIDHVCGECDDGDAKAREHISERGRFGEDWVFPPRLALRPGVIVKGTRHISQRLSVICAAINVGLMNERCGCLR